MLIRPGSARSDRPQGYQQALDDFGITQLLTQLGNYSDTEFEKSAIARFLRFVIGSESDKTIVLHCRLTCAIWP
ncbi:MAG TPA: hypothetical protein V6D14_31700 [Coleofasciculaceae cyanobacterium]|jgi:hypothetical protein